MRAMSILGSYIFFLILPTQSAYAEDDAYVYQNCADQMLGVPLTRCATIEVSKKLDDIRVNSYIEPGVIPDSSPDFRVLNSKKLGIVIPKGYSRYGSWVYKDRKYFKTNIGFYSKLFETHVDSVVVVDNSSGANVKSWDGPSSRPLFSYWYSPEKGVVAIGFPKPGDSGDVYYCSSKHCLFYKP